ncbi:MAG: glycosyltransferase family 4 protein [Gemmatimonadota bacterium]|nr:glycosyltransferase family 4 protein [Gemmatimonadota bacterium]
MTANGLPRPSGTIVVTPWYGGTHGGVAVAAESLVHGLIAAGGEAVVVKLVPDGWMPRSLLGTAGEEIVELCVRARSTAAGTLPQRMGFHLRQGIARQSLRRIVRKYKVRVVHFAYAIEGYAELARQARRMGLKVVTTFHGADVNNTLQHPATRHIVDDIVAESNHVTVVSRTLFDRLTTAIPDVAPRLSLIHNSVPTTFATAAEALLATDVAAPRWDVLLVGQLIPRKGGDVLLDALARVREQIPTVRAAFAGAGYFEEELRAQVSRLGLSSNVEFLGELPRESLTAAYRSAKLLVIASRAEGLPLVLLEALWLGVPVVATEVDGMPEVVVDGVNGLLVPPEDAGALADALLRTLLDNELRRHLAGQARASIADRFSPEASTAKYLDVYRRLLAES